MKRSGYILLCTLMYFSVRSQDNKELHVGARCPDLLLNHIANYTKNSATLKDFTGKLVILDFWSTWCSSCIGAFPKMEALQREFGDSIQVILVNRQSDGEIDSAVRKYMKTFKMPNLASVTGDTILSSFFPHKTVPHHVWIDKEGKIIAITNGWNASAKNVRKVLQGIPVSFPEKRFIKMTYKDRMLSVSQPALEPYKLYQSGFMEYIPGLWSGSLLTDTDSSGNITGYYCFNCNILQLYKYLYGKFKSPDFYNNNRMLIDSASAGGGNILSELMRPEDPEEIDEWSQRYSVSYEISSAPGFAHALPELMLEDINRFARLKFGIKAAIEKRNVKCIVIEKTNEQPSARTGKVVKKNIISDSVYAFTRVPFPQLREYIKDLLREQPLPVIDQTGITGSLDNIYIEYKKDNPESLYKSLRNYGLLLTEKYMDIDMLVISKIKP